MPSHPNSGQVTNLNSNKNSNLQSLNTSQVMVDEERVDKMMDRFGYSSEYIIETLENDELNHASATYFLIEIPKEY